MKDRKTIFSIIMSVYNSDLYLLEKSIASVICQTFTNWELIILDNGSNTMQQWNWITQQCTKDKRIRGIHIDKNVGWAKGASICLAEAKGDYMTFLASDDTLSSIDCLSTIYLQIENYFPDIIWVGYLYTCDTLLVQINKD